MDERETERENERERERRKAYQVIGKQEVDSFKEVGEERYKMGERVEACRDEPLIVIPLRKKKE